MDRVNAISTIRHSEPDDLFIACESFEDRCIGAISRLNDYKTKLCVVISFLSRTRSPRGERKRKKNMSDMRQMLSQKNIGAETRRVKIDPYSPLDLLLTIQAELARSQTDLSRARVTVDISCFTKIQALFLLRFLRDRIGRGTVRLVYTLPSYYGSLDRKNLAIGYDRLVTTPFEKDEPDVIPDNGLAMIILLGHEGTRIMHAWNELEPDRTFLIQAISEGDPEPTNLAVKQNEMLVSKAKEEASDLRLSMCPATDLSGGIALFRSITKQCIREGLHRLAFVPMGPKPLVAAFALGIDGNGHVPIDIAYPVPRAYDPDYSIGVGYTYSYLWRKSTEHRSVD